MDVQARADKLAVWVAESLDGDSSNLVDELSAMHGLLTEFAQNCCDEDKPRLALICYMIADLTCILGCHVAMLSDEKQQAEGGHDRDFSS